MIEKDVFDSAIITGAGGVVGSYFDFGKKFDKEDLDVTNPASILEVFAREKPKIVIHLAAMTDIEKCEQEPAEAWKLNAAASYNVASACRRHSAKMIYVSTGMVFGSGQEAHSEDDLPSPENIYGLTKYVGELVTKKQAGEYMIVRTSWIFGGGKDKDKKFVGNIIGQIRDGAPIKVANDLIGSPTYAQDFVQRLKSLLLENKKGIFHIVNSGQASRLDMASEIASMLSSAVHPEGVSYLGFGSAKRLSHEVLLTRITPLRSWQEALRHYLAEEW